MIERMEFGSTGHDSTRTLFGAAALWSATQAEADKILDLLFKHGINHIDTAASYGDAELRIGPWMPKYRDEFFLATKTEKRTYEGAKEELHRSFERMQVDSIDLWQMHLLVDPEDWETAMGPGGALEAFVEAREQGLVRFLGVTGHGVTIPEMHIRSLRRFDFDSVLLPYNYAMMQNPKYAADFAQLLQLCRERKVAVQTIKTITRGPWGDKAKSRNTWYEPLESQEDIDRAVHWAMNSPNLFLNTAGDMDLLPKILDAAGRFERSSGQQLETELEQMEMAPLFV